MRRRSYSVTADSTELLLDTICNTFGGILFISLLVVLLVNTSGGPASSTASLDQDTLELMELDNLRDELVIDELESVHAELMEALDQQGEYLASFDRTADLEELEKLKRLRIEIATMHENIGQNEAGITSLELERAKLIQANKQLNDSMKAKERELADATRAVQEAIQENGVSFTVSLAQARSGVAADFCLIANGKLFGPSGRWSGDIIRDSQLFGPTRYQVNPAAGMPITNDRNGRRLLDQRMAGLGTISIFVGKSSFAQWKAVESALQRNRVSYRLELTETDEPIVITGDPGNTFFQ